MGGMNRLFLFWSCAIGCAPLLSLLPFFSCTPSLPAPLLSSLCPTPTLALAAPAASCCQCNHWPISTSAAPAPMVSLELTGNARCRQCWYQKRNTFTCMSEIIYIYIYIYRYIYIYIIYIKYIIYIYIYIYIYICTSIYIYIYVCVYMYVWPCLFGPKCKIL